MVERRAVFHASRRSSQAVLHHVPGLTEERKGWIAEMAERWGSSTLSLASITVRPGMRFPDDRDGLVTTVALKAYRCHRSVF